VISEKRVLDAIINWGTQRDVVSWNSMISGYALHRYGKEALKVFDQMQLANVKPNDTTFVGVLSACSHTGLVDKGLQYFDSMRQEYSITPTEDHYGCVIGLLGRAGCLDEAEEIINNMPFEPPLSVLGALLGACRIHKKTELGKHVAECIFKMEPKTTAPYIALSNIYAAAGRWNDVIDVRKCMKDKAIKKNPGCSWVEVKNRVYTFLTGDKSHPETENIYAVLEGLVCA
jgi:pentatricopeptide repeat protein